MPEIPYTRESELVRDVLDLLMSLGIPAWRNNSGAFKGEGRFIRFGLKGSSDVLGCLPVRVWDDLAIDEKSQGQTFGFMLAIECKIGKGVPTPQQQAFLDAITRAGGIAFVARSLEDVEEVLRQHGVDPSVSIVT